MSINVKKYTKDQMAKMVEDAQEKTAALEAEIIELKRCMRYRNIYLCVRAQKGRGRVNLMRSPW